jgi:hypothetical protein
MKPVLYYWTDMVRDYARLLAGGMWRWCPHCRRPVEHTTVRQDDEATQELTCLDCGLADPEVLRRITRW